MSKTAPIPVNPGASAARVLIIKLSALGDFVLSLGAMQAVREHHPKARITGAEGRAAMGKSGRDYVTANFSKTGLQAATLNVYKRVLEEKCKAG